MKVAKKIPVLVVSLLFASTLLMETVSCGSRPAKIGAVLPLSGPGAYLGRSIDKGMRLAVALLNRSGGINGRRMEMSVVDSGSRGEKAVLAMKRFFVRDGVSAVIGGCTAREAMAMARVAERLHGVLLSPCASFPPSRAKDSFTFSTWPSSSRSARVLSDFAAFTLHADRITALRGNGPASDESLRAFVDAFGHEGRTVKTMRFRSGKEGLNVARQAAGRFLRGSQVLLLAAGIGNTMEGLSVLQAESRGRPLLSLNVPAGVGGLARLPGNAEGVIFPMPFLNTRNRGAEVQDFLSAYRLKFNANPDIYAACGYDAVYILASAMAGNGLNREQIRHGLMELKEAPSVMGPVTFNAEGEIERDPSLFVVKGGKAVRLKKALNEILPSMQERVARRRFGG